MNFFIKSIFLFMFSFASVYGNEDIEKQIGSMLMVGFYGTSISQDSQICQDIARYNLAGVILFDFNPTDSTKPKNISSKEQLLQLTKQLQQCSQDGNLLIAVDQEGGKVQRLKSKYGFFGNFPSANSVAQMGSEDILESYSQMAKELNSVGINYNLAPVVDLAVNPSNYVIYQLQRSFGSKPEEVSRVADIFLKAMHSQGVLTSLKHFPGHGSSLGDTHKGYVDVTDVWSDAELEPYRLLSKKADSVMVAHVFNAKIDDKHPASLSSKTINGILRKEIGYGGVVITDDLQMGAISQAYSLQETLKLGINAGNDILLFGNQLDPNKTVQTKVLVDTIKALIDTQDIQLSDIKQAHLRVQSLKTKLNH